MNQESEAVKAAIVPWVVLTSYPPLFIHSHTDNIYFQFERKRILDETDHTVPIVNAQVAFQVSLAYRMKPPRKHRKSHGKISFLDLSRTVARRWKLLDPNLKRFFQAQAHTESLQYQPVFEEWKRKVQRLKKNGGDDGDEDCSSANREDDGPNDKPPSLTVSTTSDQDGIMKEDFVVSEDDDFDSVVSSLEEEDKDQDESPSPSPPQLVLLEAPVETLPPKDITSSLVEMARSSTKKRAIARREKKPSFLEEFPSPTTLRYCPLIARAQTQGYNLFDPITSDSMSILFQQEWTVSDRSLVPMNESADHIVIFFFCTFLFPILSVGSLLATMHKPSFNTCLRHLHCSIAFWWVEVPEPSSNF